MERKHCTEVLLDAPVLRPQNVHAGERLGVVLLELGKALQRTQVRVAGKSPAIAGPHLAAGLEAKGAKARGREHARDPPES